MDKVDQPRIVSEAPSAEAANGYVLLDHPDGVALTFTPSAACETAQRLKDAAAEAEAQTPPADRAG